MPDALLSLINVGLAAFLQSLIVFLFYCNWEALGAFAGYQLPLAGLCFFAYLLICCLVGAGHAAGCLPTGFVVPVYFPLAFCALAMLLYFPCACVPSLCSFSAGVKVRMKGKEPDAPEDAFLIHLAGRGNRSAFQAEAAALWRVCDPAKRSQPDLRVNLREWDAGPADGSEAAIVDYVQACLCCGREEAQAWSRPIVAALTLYSGPVGSTQLSAIPPGQRPEWFTSQQSGQLVYCLSAVLAFVGLLVVVWRVELRRLRQAGGVELHPC